MKGSHLAKAVEAPGLGWHWGSEAAHQELPRGERVAVGTSGTMEASLLGPSRAADGTMKRVGALRRAMATGRTSGDKGVQRGGVLTQRN